jgi:DNA-directed RNA polymerase subunit RPC12/RpoP
MSTPIYFMQECPTCGRSLRVRVEYLGKKVVCQHCRSKFQACDPASGMYPPEDSGIAMLERADQLLASVDELRDRRI